MPNFNKIIKNIKSRNTINVLFCGGRRVGKTSIMAAMEENMRTRYPAGEITLQVPNAGKLAENRRIKQSKFMKGNDESMTFYAEEGESQTPEANEYACTVSLDGRAGLSLNFIDVPGEWFVDPEFEKEIKGYMEEAQILVIAVDSPHLVECVGYQEEVGKYHEVFNRAPEVTRFVEGALQGDHRPRLIMFVPVKCERYRGNGVSGGAENMQHLLSMVHKGYGELINICKRADCAIVCAPCFTLGGVEFLQFVPRRENFDLSGNVNDGDLQRDEYGQPLDDIMTDENGFSRMTYVSQYLYLYNANGRRFYKPEDCDQPLNYILLFLIGIGKMRKGYPFSGWINKIFNLPDQKILDSCKAIIKPEIKTDEESGFEIIHDPYDMF